MSLEAIYNKFVCISPYIEVLLRQLYWKNVDRLSRFKPRYDNKQEKTSEIFSFSKIIDILKENGVGDGVLLIVHSSYDALKGAGLSPEEMIDALLELIGNNGTLAMPVIRRYKEQYRKGKQYLSYNMDNVICTYNVQKTPVITGYLPYYLMRHPKSVTSRHPLNSMTALGSLAKPMMERNLYGDMPSPHGPYSSWKFCLDHNAIVVGLGIDLMHYLTITHVTEEAFSDWPIKDWYRERKFKIMDKDFVTDIVVKERQPKWGTLYYADRNLKKKLLKEKMLHIEKIGNIEISLINSQEYISYLRTINKDGFPYIVPRKYLYES
jgi:aminoglycoside 3-N-acetyltransferase